ncbi:YegP family protein [Piscinibacterium candidicorallinum]|jgi:uncharacterized protein YegP (UPF0339 family)|uniref:YegP family protein n=1 Tax=Piscinibacterium candidicorallinum TaxID=1793872 RepID=A0ABV7H3L9_9BURK|nr:hypothetical protein IP84_01750 [beta proteobacterium AAP99]
MSGKFELKTAGNGQIMFNLLAANGQVILTSETYKARASAINGVESVKKNAPETHRFAFHVSSNGRHYFTLKAANGQVIGTSQMYSTPDSARQGMLSCQSNAPSAALEDLTR